LFKIKSDRGIDVKAKIVIYAIFIALYVVCCHGKSSQVNKSKDIEQTHDTIYFGSKELMGAYKNIFMVDGAHPGGQGTDLETRCIEFDTKGMGHCVGIDSVFYSQRYGNRFVAVVKIASFWTQLIYYNGDSIFTEVVANNNLSIQEYKTNKFTVICISEKRWAFGSFAKTMLFYRIDNDGLLWTKRYYDAVRIKSGLYSPAITIKANKQSVIIYKNNIIDFVYK
jgi:hypothetical protein